MKEVKRVRIILNQEKEILVLDFTNCGIEKALAVIKEADLTFRSLPQTFDSILLMSKVSGMRFNSEVINAFQDIMRRQEPYLIAAAVVGAAGLQKVAYDFLKALSKKMNHFETENEALQWLTSF